MVTQTRNDCASQKPAQEANVAPRSLADHVKQNSGHVTHVMRPPLLVEGHMLHGCTFIFKVLQDPSPTYDLLRAKTKERKDEDAIAQVWL